MTFCGATIRVCFILCLGLVLQVAFSQENVLIITGQVIDSVSSEPLPNVNVIIRGEQKGTSTDASGRFKLTLSTNLVHTLVFSHVAYHKVTKQAFSKHPRELQPTIKLVPRSIVLGEVVVTAPKDYVLTKYAVQRSVFQLGGEEFERLGEEDMERAMQHLLSFVVQPLRDRMWSNKNDFTLYVNGIWKESMLLNQIDPFSVRRVLVWEGLGRDKDNQHDIFPIGLPLRRGRYVVLIETN